MSTRTSIEWTDVVWNPVTGCSKVSEGCRHCYAEAVAHRFWGAREFTDVQCHEDRLDAPLHWKKPLRIFVNSMSDLFHEDVPEAFIASAYAVMLAAYQHEFQVLTKRPERRRHLLNHQSFRDDIGLTAAKLINAMRGSRSSEATENLAAWHAGVVPNIWEGVSVEDQKSAEERLLSLMGTPALVRWVSAEPLLGPVNLKKALPFKKIFGGGTSWHDWPDWVVVGGESGPGARPCDVAWIRSIRDQCQRMDVPCFVKQLGSQPFVIEGSRDAQEWSALGASAVMDDCGGIHTNDRKGADIREFPDDLQVRAYPHG